MGVVLWIGLSLIPGAIAQGKGRSFFAYFVLGLVISPLIAAVVAAVAKPLESESAEGTGEGDTRAVELRTGEPITGISVEEPGWYQVISKDELPSALLKDVGVGDPVYLSAGYRLRPQETVAPIIDEAVGE